MKKSLSLAALAVTSGMAMAQVVAPPPPASGGASTLPALPSTTAPAADGLNKPALPGTTGSNANKPALPGKEALPATGMPGEGRSGVSVSMDNRFGTLDANSDGMLSNSEVSRDAKLKGSFKSLDSNNDGNLSSAEYQASLKVENKSKTN